MPPALKPAQLATQHLQKVWQKQHNEPPPLDLMEHVVTVTIACGYTKQSVEKLADAYAKRMKAPPRGQGPAESSA